jgi:hypothetical protein
MQEAQVFVSTVKAHFSSMDKPVPRDHGASLHHILYKARQSAAKGVRMFPEVQTKASPSPAPALSPGPASGSGAGPGPAGVVLRRDLAAMIEDLCAGTNFVPADLDKSYYTIFGSCTHAEVCFKLTVFLPGYP